MPVLWGTATSTNAETITWPSTIGSGLFSEFSKMDVVLNVRTFAGGGQVTFLIQEGFPCGGGGTSFLTTARLLLPITTTGVYYLTNDTNPLTGVYANGASAQMMMGMGSVKVVVTAPNSMTAYTADIVAVFYN